MPRNPRLLPCERKGIGLERRAKTVGGPDGRVHPGLRCLPHPACLAGTPVPAASLPAGLRGPVALMKVLCRQAPPG